MTLEKQLTGITLGFYLWATVMPAYADAFTDAAQTARDDASGLISDMNDSTPTYDNGVIDLGGGETVDIQELFPGTSASNTEPEGTYLPEGYQSGTSDLESLYRDEVSVHDESPTTKTSLFDDANSEDPSTQGTAYSILTETMTMSRPDLSNDPVLDQSEEIFANIDDVTSSFADCSDDSELSFFQRTVHVPDLKNCNRVLDFSGTRTVEHRYSIGVLSHHSGPANIEMCGDGCIKAWMGRVGDNYWGGNCAIYEETTRYRIDNPEAIDKVILELAKFDDYMQVWIGDTKVYNGPNENFPPETAGACELGTSWSINPNTDITEYFKNVEPGEVLEFKIRVSVAGNGEGYARLNIDYDSSKVIADNGWEPEDGMNAIKAINDGFWEGSYSCTQMPAFDTVTISDEGSEIVDTTTCVTRNGIRACEDDFPNPSPIPGISNFCEKVEVTGGKGFYEGQMDCWTDINGVEHCPYNEGGNLDSCTTFEENPQCGFISSECVEGAQGDSGLCYNTKETWDCGYDTVVDDAQVNRDITCDGPVRCTGLECIDPDFTQSQSFSQAAALLNVASMMGNDMDCNADTIEDDRVCKIFKGEAQECKIAVGGLQNCCETPDGVSVVEYIQLMMAIKKADAAFTNAEFAKGTIQSTFQSGYLELREPIAEAVGDVAKPFVDTMDAVSGAVDEVQQAFTDKFSEWATEAFGEEAIANAGLESGAGFAAEGTIMGDAAAAMEFIGTVYMYYQIAMIIIQIVWACEQEELELGTQRELKNCKYIGSYCAKKIWKVCIEERESYCCFNSPLSRIVQEQIRPQLDMGWGTPENPMCAGVSPEQLTSVDWSQVNLDEWVALLNISGMYPNPQTLTMEAMTGTGSTLDLDGTRMNSLDRTMERLESVPVDDLRKEAQKDLPDPS